MSKKIFVDKGKYYEDIFEDYDSKIRKLEGMITEEMRSRGFEHVRTKSRDIRESAFEKKWIFWQFYKKGNDLFSARSEAGLGKVSSNLFLDITLTKKRRKRKR